MRRGAQVTKLGLSFVVHRCVKIIELGARPFEHGMMCVDNLAGFGISVSDRTGLDRLLEPPIEMPEHGEPV
jgi:hypothetical protein